MFITNQEYTTLSCLVSDIYDCAEYKFLRFNHIDAWNIRSSLRKIVQLVTKAITSGLLNGVGDAIAQLSFSDEDFNWKRFAIFQLLVRVVFD